MKYFFSIFLFIFITYSCRHQAVNMNDFSVRGIDVSHYQAAINWDLVAAHPVHFAFVKATEGTNLSDSLYCHNWEELKRVGIKRGAYHFFHPDISAEEQARNFMEWADLQDGDLAPVLDIEVLNDVSKVQLISSVTEWLFLIEIKYNVKPIIYTNLKFYNKYLAGYFDDYPVWIARYNTRMPLLACGRDWDFWQYGNKGRIEGIKGNVDFNVFNGTLDQLEQFCLAPKQILSVD